ncbi:helix-turn-helix domain-containing protein [Pandoraea sp. PE-S2T-3]|uniref:helix-turn-helix domain-containing protein n=1 Tax=Pandoraea sp. PE-S2T-3 TaxID=1986993 RepID=UPI000B4006F9|nr:helix-turn-helix transcriptional regulator [Pandoraea sp. PE-S2T-3]
MSVFAKRLKEARKAAGLTQEKLGVLAGVDEMSASARMNQYERGKHAPDYSIVERIAGILNLPTTYFFAPDDSEAKLLVAYHRLDGDDKARLLSHALEMIREKN